MARKKELSNHAIQAIRVDQIWSYKLAYSDSKESPPVFPSVSGPSATGVTKDHFTLHPFQLNIPRDRTPVL